MAVKKNTAAAKAAKETTEKAVKAAKETTEKAAKAAKEVSEKAVKAAKETKAKTETAVKETKAKAEKAVKESTEKAEKDVKSAVKSAAKKAVKAKNEVYFEFGGLQFNAADVEKKVRAASGKKASEIKSLKIYVKAEDCAAYYIINGTESGRVNL